MLDSSEEIADSTESTAEAIQKQVGTKSKRSRAGYHGPNILVEEPKTG